jgi:hypothetical protein
VSEKRRARPLLVALAIPLAAVLASSGHVSTASFGGPATVSGGPAALSGGPAVGPADGPAVMSEYSANWGGYVARGTTFRYVRATFTVPKLNCAKTPGASGNPTMVGEWVGLDTSTVEQDGIQGQCNGRNAQYVAWYEMYPKSPVYPNMTVSPGDTIQSSVWYVAGKREYELILDDLTNREGFTRWAQCGKNPCANSSAEVIAEAPGKAAGGGYFPLTDFGTASFSGVSITDAAGQRGTFTAPYWQATRFQMEDNSGQVKASVSGLAQNGTVFKAYWQHES